jgi:hypothetical protein
VQNRIYNGEIMLHDLMIYPIDYYGIISFLVAYLPVA